MCKHYVRLMCMLYALYDCIWWNVVREYESGLTVALIRKRRNNDETHAVSLYGFVLFIRECIACWRIQCETKIDIPYENTYSGLSRREKWAIKTITYTPFGISVKFSELWFIFHWNSIVRRGAIKTEKNQNGSSRCRWNWIRKICDISTRWFAYWKFSINERDSTNGETMWRHT